MDLYQLNIYFKFYFNQFQNINQLKGLLVFKPKECCFQKKLRVLGKLSILAVNFFFYLNLIGYLKYFF